MNQQFPFHVFGFCACANIKQVPRYKETDPEVQFADNYSNNEVSAPALTISTFVIEYTRQHSLLIPTLYSAIMYRKPTNCFTGITLLSFLRNKVCRTYKGRVLPHKLNNKGTYFPRACHIYVFSLLCG